MQLAERFIGIKIGKQVRMEPFCHLLDHNEPE